MEKAKFTVSFQRAAEPLASGFDEIDFIIQTKAAQMFITGPSVIKQVRNGKGNASPWLRDLVARKPNKSVVAWIDNVKQDDIYLSVITIGEIKRGIEQSRDARRSTCRSDTGTAAGHDLGAGGSRRHGDHRVRGSVDARSTPRAVANPGPDPMSPHHWQDRATTRRGPIAGDAWSSAKAFSFRKVTVDRGVYWKAQRWARFMAWLGEGILRRARKAITAEAKPRAHSSSSSSSSSSSLSSSA
jgi:hypothetical protein